MWLCLKIEYTKNWCLRISLPIKVAMFWACPIFGHTQKRWTLSVRYTYGYVYIYMYTYIYIYICTYTYIYVHIHIYIYLSIYTYIYIYTVHVPVHSYCITINWLLHQQFYPCFSVKSAISVGYTCSLQTLRFTVPEVNSAISVKRAGSQLKFSGGGEFDPLWREVDVNKPFNILVQSGWGDLIPHEEKWKLINHSTYLFRGGGEFDPLWREVDVNKPFNILVQSGWGDLIPYEAKWS